MTRTQARLDRLHHFSGLECWPDRRTCPRRTTGDRAGAAALGVRSWTSARRGIHGPCLWQRCQAARRQYGAAWRTWCGGPPHGPHSDRAAGREARASWRAGPALGKAQSCFAYHKHAWQARLAHDRTARRHGAKLSSPAACGFGLDTVTNRSLRRVAHIIPHEHRRGAAGHVVDHRGKYASLVSSRHAPDPMDGRDDVPGVEESHRYQSSHGSQRLFGTLRIFLAVNAAPNRPSTSARNAAPRACVHDRGHC